jgi:hypothetical protein
MTVDLLLSKRPLRPAIRRTDRAISSLGCIFHPPRQMKYSGWDRRVTNSARLAHVIQPTGGDMIFSFTSKKDR